MSTAAQYTYYEGYTEPLPVPAGGKDAAYNAYYNNGSTYSVSPPEADPSVSSGVGYSSTGGGTYSYAGSTTGDYDSSAGSAAGIDFNEYMQDRFAESFDPIPLDRSVARQAQTSGQLNGKQQELLELQKKAQARLARTRARFAEGMSDAREVRADLEWTQKKVSSMKSKASRKHPKEYKKARERYPSPEY
ncbi:Biogenesis of lysosome-related organelles complex 1 subunit KXD1 [Zalerion maritima]|uniref:Biogenesis of lysosome-related organelles complex 1 subunit KXD1 n=1 Tax=Zalerion maritima TaxID=339359 RepID=A0AAD5RN19_9PEZI|nr:Biogenesis of lysosome-related organelles complex 1 subunit KXD1 [Zalerion maritima]